MQSCEPLTATTRTPSSHGFSNAKNVARSSPSLAATTSSFQPISVKGKWFRNLSLKIKSPLTQYPISSNHVSSLSKCGNQNHSESTGKGDQAPPASSLSISNSLLATPSLLEPPSISGHGTESLLSLSGSNRQPTVTDQFSVTRSLSEPISKPLSASNHQFEATRLLSEPLSISTRLLSEPLSISERQSTVTKAAAMIDKPGLPRPSQFETSSSVSKWILFLQNSISLPRSILRKEMFQELATAFEEVYGRFLQYDVFASKDTSLLPLFGFSRDGGTEIVPCLLVVPPVKVLSDTILYLREIKALALVVVPKWENHTWYTHLLEKASHRLSFALGDELWTLCGDRDPNIKHNAFFVDTRLKKRAHIMQEIKINPKQKERERPPREILKLQPGDFLSKRPRNHLNLAWFLKWGKSEDIPAPLFARTIIEIEKGVDTDYPGGGDFLRNYASRLTLEEENKAVETAKEAVEKGWAAGPFELPPFPNPACDKQAIVTRLFTIPKHKWANDGRLRLIFHKSYPLGLSINSVTPHLDVATFFPPGQHNYFSLAPAMSMIHKGGKGTLIIQFDARDAYKQLRVATKDLHQQVFMAGGKFYVDFCASFGSLYGNDAYSRFAYVHRVCLARAAKCPLLQHYVDNYFDPTPFRLSAKETMREALAKVIRLRRELEESGIFYHEFQGPTTRSKLLGWVLDTIKMTVEMPEERRVFMLSFLGTWEIKEKCSLKELNSLIGILIFLSMLLGGIKAFTGTLMERRNDMTRATITTTPITQRMRTTIRHLHFVITEWNGIARIFDRSWSAGDADVVIYCDVALDDNPLPDSFGKGAFCLPQGAYYSKRWREGELAEAMRERKHSSTHLELLNMLEAVLLFAGQMQKVLCIGDNTASVRIAKARYGESANEQMENRLRQFDVECCRRDLSVKFKWEPRSTTTGKIADGLSRGEVVIAVDGRDLSRINLNATHTICLFV